MANNMSDDWRTNLNSNTQEFFNLDFDTTPQATEPAQEVKQTANDKAKEALNKVAQAKQRAEKTLTKVDLLKMQLRDPKIMEQFALALPQYLKGQEQRFIRSLLTLVSANPQIAECTQDTLLGAIMTMLQLGLDPAPAMGECTIVPFNNRAKGIYEAQFIIQYRGLEQLAYRAGARKFTAHEVFSNDVFSICYGLNEDLVHKPVWDKDGKRGGIVGYYATVTPPSGDTVFCYMTKKEVEEHRTRFSKTKFEKGKIWFDNFDAMAIKTVIRKVIKFAPLSAEFMASVQKDEGIIRIEPDKLPGVKDVFDTTAEYPEEQEEK